MERLIYDSGEKGNFQLDFYQKMDKITEPEVKRIMKVWGEKDEGFAI